MACRETLEGWWSAPPRKTEGLGKVNQGQNLTFGTSLCFVFDEVPKGALLT